MRGKEERWGPGGEFCSGYVLFCSGACLAVAENVCFDWGEIC